jgi:hypothetical protein
VLSKHPISIIPTTTFTAEELLDQAQAVLKRSAILVLISTRFGSMTGSKGLHFAAQAARSEIEGVSEEMVIFRDEFRR